MSARLLLCTDLDRTLLPNGEQPESPPARALFARLAARPGVTLVYVTGRHRALVQAALDEFQLPRPAHVIADVGTSIYDVGPVTWQHSHDWQVDIAADWAGATHAQLVELFAGLTQLELQEPEKQNDFKLSYYLALEIDRRALMARMQALLQDRGVHASLIWSIDDLRQVGLLDVLPAGATKLHALDFLRTRLGFSLAETLFAGDSGNDLPVLASNIPAVLVANASEVVRTAALQQATAQGHSAALYLAHGGFQGMNGNYSAGILEGLAHFLPASLDFLDPEQDHD
jgi:HAD superfamily hydrolase (TIGR01484 family)